MGKAPRRLTAPGSGGLGHRPTPRQTSAPRAIVSGKQTFDGLSVENVLLETKPGCWLGGNIYRPLQSGKHPAVVKLAEAGQAVYLIEPFRRAMPEKARYHHTFQRSGASNQAQDLLTSLKWLEKDKPTLRGLSDAAVWVRVAAFTGTDADWQRVFPAPGVQWAGGWDAVKRLL